MESDLERAFANQCRALRLPEPERELVFARPRRWRFDFAWPVERVAAEIEGGTFTAGRHTRGKGFEADCEKYNAALALGWRVYRFTAAMVRDGRAVTAIEEALGRVPTVRRER